MHNSIMVSYRKTLLNGEIRSTAASCRHRYPLIHSPGSGHLAPAL